MTVRTARRGVTAGLTFTETMVGTLTMGADDPAAGADDPSAVASVLRAQVVIDDVSRFTAPDGRRARLTAVLDSPRLRSAVEDMASSPVSPGMRRVRDGKVGLFVPDGPAGSAGRVMQYEAPVDIGGRRLWLAGTKIVDPAPAAEGWRATTTLHVRLHDGADTDAPVLAAGILRLRVGALAALLLSLRPVPHGGLIHGATTVGGFAVFFTRCLVDTYLRNRAA